MAQASDLLKDPWNGGLRWPRRSFPAARGPHRSIREQHAREAPPDLQDRGRIQLAPESPPGVATSPNSETMILPLLLTTLASASPAPVQDRAPAVATPRRSRRATDFRDSLLRSGGSENSTTLGGNYTVGGLGPFAGASRTHVPGVFQIQLDDPGTGWQESVLLGVPSVRAYRNPPLLVMFHAYDVSEWDCYLNSPLFQEALDRGWFVLAPLGANQVNFGIPYAQVNIEYALDLFTAVLPVDPNRIYGAGFSMGGGTMMSYAARHHDLDRTRFAAVVNHTGGISVANSYANSTNTAYFDNPLLFGGPPSANPFLYSQASVLDIEDPSLVVDPTTDQARNLAHVPVLNEHAINDPLVYLVDQTITVHNWMSQTLGFPQSFLLTPPFAVHSWSTIDTNTALNWLYSKTLDTPSEGEHRMLADREASWLHFYIYQDAPGAFTPFRWNLESSINRLTIDETENLQQIVVDTLSLGLNTGVNLDLVLGTADSTAEVVTLTGYNIAPQEVLRNGVSSNDWTWDAAAKTVTINESPGRGAPSWKIRP